MMGQFLPISRRSRIRVSSGESPNSELRFRVPGYELRRGSPLDRAQLVKVMQRAYQDLGASGGAHLAATVQRHLSNQSHLWWVNCVDEPVPAGLPGVVKPTPSGCLWLTEAIDQWTGLAQAYVFLIYVAPEHRRKGIGKALMEYAQSWAKAQGYGAIGLQVFESNLPAMQLYAGLGYQSRAVWMTLEL